MQGEGGLEMAPFCGRLLWMPPYWTALKRHAQSSADQGISITIISIIMKVHQPNCQRKTLCEEGRYLLVNLFSSGCYASIFNKHTSESSKDATDNSGVQK